MCALGDCDYAKIKWTIYANQPLTHILHTYNAVRANFVLGENETPPKIHSEKIEYKPRIFSTVGLFHFIVCCRRCVLPPVFWVHFFVFFFLGWVALSTYHTEFNIVYCGVMVRNGCGHNICDMRLYYSLHEYLYVSRKIFCLILAKLLHIVVAHCCSNCTPKNCSVCLFYFIPNFRLLFWAICSTGITP